MAEFRFSGKEFSWYWPMIVGPLAILLVWSVAAFIVAMTSLSTYNSIFTGLNGIIIQVAVFGYLGYHIIDTQKNARPAHSAWGGALVGIIAGFVGAILSILMIKLIPSFLDVAIQQAVAQGASADMVRNISNVMAWVGLVTGPIFGGLIGALFSWIGGAITNKVVNK